jgi:hypothetical protein
MRARVRRDVIYRWQRRRPPSTPQLAVVVLEPDDAGNGVVIRHDLPDLYVPRPSSGSKAARSGRSPSRTEVIRKSISRNRCDRELLVCGGPIVSLIDWRMASSLRAVLAVIGGISACCECELER